MSSDKTSNTADDIAEIGDEAARAIKRGAKRVGRAVEDGADAIDDALRPTFAEQLCDVAVSIIDDPKSSPRLARGLVQDHPWACLGSAALVGIGIAKFFGLARER